MGIKELSKVSGFSVSTVSKALNDSHEISKRTKTKIKELADLYNYVPNKYASALRGKKTGVIAIGIPKNQLKRYAFYLEGIEEESRNSGRITMIQQFDLSPSQDIKAISIIRNNSDGVIFLSNRRLKSTSLNKVLNTARPTTFPMITHTIPFSPSSNTQCRAEGKEICKGLIQRIQSLK